MEPRDWYWRRRRSRRGPYDRLDRPWSEVPWTDGNHRLRLRIRRCLASPPNQVVKQSCQEVGQREQDRQQRERQEEQEQVSEPMPEQTNPLRHVVPAVCVTNDVIARRRRPCRRRDMRSCADHAGGTDRVRQRLHGPVTAVLNVHNFARFVSPHPPLFANGVEPEGPMFRVLVEEDGAGRHDVQPKPHPDHLFRGELPAEDGIAFQVHPFRDGPGNPIDVSRRERGLGTYVHLDFPIADGRRLRLCSARCQRTDKSKHDKELEIVHDSLLKATGQPIWPNPILMQYSIFYSVCQVNPCYLIKICCKISRYFC